MPRSARDLAARSPLWDFLWSEPCTNGARVAAEFAGVVTYDGLVASAPRSDERIEIRSLTAAIAPRPDEAPEHLAHRVWATVQDIADDVCVLADADDRILIRMPRER